MIVIHGDNTALSRKKLQELISVATQSGNEIVRLEAKKLTSAQLEEALVETSLFGDEKTIIVEELHSLPTSNRKKELINQVSQYQDKSIILYETKLLTANMLKKLGTNNDFSFKISNSLWKLLDHLTSKNKKELLLLLREAIKQNDEYFVYTMIIRQVRQLIQAKTGGTLKGAPFMISKLKGQANSLSLDKLLETHQKLHRIDIKQKNSQLHLGLSQELDLLLFRL